MKEKLLELIIGKQDEIIKMYQFPEKEKGYIGIVENTKKWIKLSNEITELKSQLQDHVTTKIEVMKDIKDRIIDWFVENYIEDKKQCEFLLKQAERKYCFTKEQFYEGCKEFRLWRDEKDSLETHIKLLGEMSLIGIKAYIAGIKLREALLYNERVIPLKMKTTKQYPIVCPSCKGSGFISSVQTISTFTSVTEICPACNGNKTVICTETIEDHVTTKIEVR